MNLYITLEKLFWAYYELQKRILANLANLTSSYINLLIVLFLARIRIRVILKYNLAYI